MAATRTALRNETSVIYPQDTVLTVYEAKGMLRDIITLCERQPHKRELKEARAKAQVSFM